MKIIVKYLWTLILVPTFLFIKGDLNLNTFVALSEFGAGSDFEQRMSKVIEKPKSTALEVNVSPVSDNKNFSAEGLPVELYDDNYNLINKSQVRNNRVRFETTRDIFPGMRFHVISSKSSDEIIIKPDSINVVLQIYEEHLHEDVTY